MVNNSTNTNYVKETIFSKFIAFMLLYWASSIKAQALIDLESELVFTGYNDVFIPGDEGTHLFILSAPLETKSEGSLTNDISIEPFQKSYSLSDCDFGLNSDIWL